MWLAIVLVLTLGCEKEQPAREFTPDVPLSAMANASPASAPVPATPNAASAWSAARQFVIAALKVSSADFSKDAGGDAQKAEDHCNVTVYGPWRCFGYVRLSRGAGKHFVILESPDSGTWQLTKDPEFH